jgi:general secretion pathway protein I
VKVRSKMWAESVRGFSLLEMLVALVILSLSLGALYKGATRAIQNTSVADQYTRAVMLAESMIAASNYVTAERASISGEFEIYTWEARSWPADISDNTEADAPVIGQPLQYLSVTVTWPGGKSDRQLELLTVVPLQEALE